MARSEQVRVHAKVDILDGVALKPEIDAVKAMAEVGRKGREHEQRQCVIADDGRPKTASCQARNPTRIERIERIRGASTGSRDKIARCARWQRLEPSDQARCACRNQKQKFSPCGYTGNQGADRCPSTIFQEFVTCRTARRQERSVTITMISDDMPSCQCVA